MGLALRLFSVAKPTNQQTAAPRPPASPDLSPATEISELGIKLLPAIQSRFHAKCRFTKVRIFPQAQARYTRYKANAAGGVWADPKWAVAA
jgi:hypothetical protein